MIKCTSEQDLWAQEMHRQPTVVRRSQHTGSFPLLPVILPDSWGQNCAEILQRMKIPAIFSLLWSLGVLKIWKKCLFSQLTALISWLGNWNLGTWLGSVSKSYQPACVTDQMKVAPGWLAAVVAPAHTSSQSASPKLPEMLLHQLDAWKERERERKSPKA